MKTIGILGGMGPQTTMDFEMRLHTVAQRILPQVGNSGHPPLLVLTVSRMRFSEASSKP
jgi:aspartate racemase